MKKNIIFILSIGLLISQSNSFGARRYRRNRININQISALLNNLGNHLNEGMTKTISSFNEKLENISSQVDALTEKEKALEALIHNQNRELNKVVNFLVEEPKNDEKPLDPVADQNQQPEIQLQNQDRQENNLVLAAEQQENELENQAQLPVQDELQQPEEEPQNQDFPQAQIPQPPKLDDLMAQQHHQKPVIVNNPQEPQKASNNLFPVELKKALEKRAQELKKNYQEDDANSDSVSSWNSDND
jgi:hypothetical protein